MRERERERESEVSCLNIKLARYPFYDNARRGDVIIPFAVMTTMMMMRRADAFCILVSFFYMKDGTLIHAEEEAALKVWEERTYFY